MPDHVEQQPIEPTLRDLYPTLSEQELKEAESNLRRYSEIALDIYRDHDAAAAVDTAKSARMIKERSKNSQRT